MKKYFLILSISMLASTSAFAFGDDLYVTANAGVSSIDMNGKFGEYKSNNSIYSIAGGYQINNYFSAEIAYTDYGTTRIDIPLISPGATPTSSPILTSTPSSVSVRAIQLSAVGHLPINEKLSLTGRLGISRDKVDFQIPVWSVTSTTAIPNGVIESIRVDTARTSQTQNKAVLGVGINYKIANNTDLRAEYSVTSRLYDSNLSTLMIGLTYHFK